MLVAAIFHFVPPSPRTPRFLLLFLLSSPRELWGGSHRILLLSLPCTIPTLFPVRTLLALVRLPPIFSAPHSSKQGFSTTICTSSSPCRCFAHSFLFGSQRSNSLASSSSYFRICAPPLHAVGLEILGRSPALPHESALTSNASALLQPPSPPPWNAVRREAGKAGRETRKKEEERRIKHEQTRSKNKTHNVKTILGKTVENSKQNNTNFRKTKKEKHHINKTHFLGVCHPWSHDLSE